MVGSLIVKDMREHIITAYNTTTVETFQHVLVYFINCTCIERNGQDFE